MPAIQDQLNNENHEPGSKRIRSLIKRYCSGCHELFHASNDCDSCSVLIAHRCEGAIKNYHCVLVSPFMHPGATEHEQARIIEVQT